MSEPCWPPPSRYGYGADGKGADLAGALSSNDQATVGDMNDRADKKKQHKTGASADDAERWSGEVTEKSHALDLEDGVFTWDDPARIAHSLKKSAEASNRRKGTPYQSAMSMLTFYLNRAGKSLSDEQRQVLEEAKEELRKAFGR